jgi:hypothetical protein
MKHVRVAVPIQLWAAPPVEEEEVETRHVPSLADLARLENNVHIMVPWAMNHHKMMANAQASHAHAMLLAESGGNKAAAATADEGIDDEGMAPATAASDEKLAALSAELAKLREMIAVVVTKQDSFVPAPPSFAEFAGAPPPPPPLPPNFMGGGGQTGPPPPPPPPPPSAASLLDSKKIDISALIQKTRKGQAKPGGVKKGPSMADVLAGTCASLDGILQSSMPLAPLLLA